MPYEIAPDKGGIAGHALMQLSAATGDATYASAALRIAQTLVANMAPGDAASTPWPFRADWRTGASRGPVSSNLSYILRLFDDLLPTHPELAAPRAALWSYIKGYQLPDIYCGGSLWVECFEDGQFDLNRNAWAPLSLAAYMIEQQVALLDAGATGLKLVLVPGVKTANAAKKAKAPKTGSVQAKAMEHPVVQRAQTLFNAEIRNVIDLRDSD